MEDALRACKEANGRGIDALVNHLGEHHMDEAQVESAITEYLNLLATMDEARVHGCVSAKPTQLGLLLGREYALSKFEQLLRSATDSGRFLWIDMEHAATVRDTLWVYEKLRDASERVGVCIQANLRRTEDDLERLLDAGGKIRLTKGAYREAPDIAFPDRRSIDRQFERHLETLFRRGRGFAVGSHDPRMIDRTLELFRSTGTPFEFQMLQGVQDPLKEVLVRGGHRVLEYIPYGPTWLPYFLRRLRERPRNVFTLLRSFVGG